MVNYIKRQFPKLASATLGVTALLSLTGCVSDSYLGRGEITDKQLQRGREGTPVDDYLTVRVRSPSKYSPEHAIRFYHGAFDPDLLYRDLNVGDAINVEFQGSREVYAEGYLVATGIKQLQSSSEFWSTVNYEKKKQNESNRKFQGGVGAFAALVIGAAVLKLVRRRQLIKE